jgi:hypothetical protein
MAVTSAAVEVRAGSEKDHRGETLRPPARQAEDGSQDPPLAFKVRKGRG